MHIRVKQNIGSGRTQVSLSPCADSLRFSDALRAVLRERRKSRIGEKSEKVTVRLGLTGSGIAENSSDAGAPRTAEAPSNTAGLMFGRIWGLFWRRCGVQFRI